jgi:uncharacterized BrkB/YihY/UPF0761 family membrane protein
MSALRSWRELLMASHRRYTSANGDALASAVTYSVLIGIAPVVLLAGVLVGWASPADGTVADLVTRAADRTMPEVVADLLDRAAGAPRGLTWIAAAMVVWSSVRAIRALRTSFRAVCGQRAGSTNPIADNLRDGWLAATLYLAVGLAVVAVAASPAPAARWVGLVALWLLVALAMWLLPWPGRGRPARRYLWSGALVATLLVALLGGVWATYLDHTMAGRDRVYGVAAAVVATAVWVALSVRAALRALSLASVLTGWYDQPPADDRPLWVVVPAYHEAAGIGATLAALAAQQDRDFSLVVADNGSTDGTGEVVRRFAGTAPFPVHLVEEPERGVGCAVDAGMRFAIAHGAELLARTDADALPRPDWTSRIRRRFAHGAEVICGASTPRRDEHPSLAERRVLPAVQRTLAIYGRYRGAHRGPEFKAPYVLCHGHNLALTAEVYQASGGAVRHRLEAGPEDVELLNRARRHTAAVVRAEDVVVETSLRRLRHWGVRNTFYWYWDRRFRPATEEEVHVR